MLWDNSAWWRDSVAAGLPRQKRPFTAQPMKVTRYNRMRGRVAISDACDSSRQDPGFYFEQSRYAPTELIMCHAHFDEF